MSKVAPKVQQQMRACSQPVHSRREEERNQREESRQQGEGATEPVLAGCCSPLQASTVQLSLFLLMDPQEPPSKLLGAGRCCLLATVLLAEWPSCAKCPPCLVLLSQSTYQHWMLGFCWLVCGAQLLSCCALRLSKATALQHRRQQSSRHGSSALQWMAARCRGLNHKKCCLCCIKLSWWRWAAALQQAVHATNKQFEASHATYERAHFRHF